MEHRLPKVGDRVNVIEKRNYGNGKLTAGTVRRLLSNPREAHPRGNKVELEEGTVGRMVSFVDEVGVQTFVDPSLREEYSKEIKAERQTSQPRLTVVERPTNRSPQFRSHKPERDTGKPGFRERNEPAVTPVNPNDLPGEDDLR